MHANQTSVPFQKLTAPAEINARDPKDYTDVDDLMASIKAVGLLQPLVVRPNGNTYEVLAGKRRFTAIGHLIKSGDWQQGAPVPVIVRDMTDEEALEASFAENTARKAMHPVREYEVFTKLVATGDSTADVAERYGITEQQVKQRLALGRLHPVILKRWRDGSINADTAKVFAQITDRKRQKAIYDELEHKTGRVDAWGVRNKLHSGKAMLSDARVKFVGLDAYKDAGGAVVEDLFGGDGFVHDVPLLDKLVADKLKTVCADLVAQGWGWAVLQSDLKGGECFSYGTLQVEPKFTPAEANAIKKAEKDLEALEQQDDGDLDAEDALRDKIDALTVAATIRSYTPEQKKRSGCIVNNDYTISYGRLKPKEKKAAKGAAVGVGDDAGEVSTNVPEPEGTGISAALLADITSAQTTAVIEALAQCPGLVLRLLAAALSPNKGLCGQDGLAPVRLNPEGMQRYTKPAGDDADDDGVSDDYDPSRSAFAEKLTEIDEKTAPKVLASVIGRAVDLRQLKFGGVDTVAARALVDAIPGDKYLAAMRSAFSPADFFKRAPLDVINAALDEMQVSGPSSKAKKSELAEVAADEATRRGWLPAELRHAAYKLRK